MKSFTQNTLASLLICVATCAHAGVMLTDQDLAQVRGEDGVTVLGDFHLNTSSFVYTDTDATGGLISFNGIKLAGVYAKRYDILSGQSGSSTVISDANTPGTFGAAVAQSMQAYLGESGKVTPGSQTAQQMAAAMASGLYTGGDVVQIAFPGVGLTGSVAPTFTISSITLSNSDASFGSFAIERIDLQGTKRWMWAH